MNRVQNHPNATRIEAADVSQIGVGRNLGYRCARLPSSYQSTCKIETCKRRGACSKGVPSLAEGVLFVAGSRHSDARLPSLHLRRNDYTHRSRPKHPGDICHKGAVTISTGGVFVRESGLTTASPEVPEKIASSMRYAPTQNQVPLRIQPSRAVPAVVRIKLVHLSLSLIWSGRLAVRSLFSASSGVCA